MTDKNAGAATDAPTPETDRIMDAFLGGSSHVSDLTSDIQRLERERDVNYKMSILNKVEAEKQYERADTAEAERDAARRDCNANMLTFANEAVRMAQSEREMLERAEKAEAALAEEKKLSAAISRDCNNTANERNEARAKLAALQKRLADAGEGLPPEAKRELVDEVLTVEAIDYDDLRAAAESIIASLKVTVEMLEAGIAADAEVIADARHQQHLAGVFATEQTKEYESIIAKRDAEIARLREFAKACAEKSTESYGTRAAARLALGEGVRAIVDEMRNAEIDAARKGRG